MEAFKVITDPGGMTVHAYPPGGKTQETLTIDEAQSLADGCNKRAEQMGLAVRYTVVPR